MQPIVIDEPYQFISPYRGRFWPWLLQKFVRIQLRRDYGIEQLQCEGTDRLKESLAAGYSVILAPNHCRPSDPSVIAETCRRCGVSPYTMASWHLFKQSRFQSFMLRRIGAFSVYREGLDRQALQASIEILEQGERPLVLFPEGVVTRTNDRLLALMEGLSFIARSAAKKRAAANPPGKVVVHPVAIRYHFHGDIDEAVHETLDSLEHRLSWRLNRDLDPIERIYRVGRALLWLKEIEYFGEPQAGELSDRLRHLIDQILVPMEEEYLEGRSEGTAVARVKALRIAILPDMIEDKVTEEERKRRWDQLADMYIAQQLGHYPPKYIASDPTRERLLETVEKFEADMSDVSRVHRPMSVTVQIGTAIEVSPRRTRGASEDLVMTEVERQLTQMLGIEGPAVLDVAPSSGEHSTVTPVAAEGQMGIGSGDEV